MVFFLISSLGEEKWFNDNLEIRQNIEYKDLYDEEYPYKDNPQMILEMVTFPHMIRRIIDFLLQKKILNILLYWMKEI